MATTGSTGLVLYLVLFWPLCSIVSSRHSSMRPQIQAQMEMAMSYTIFPAQGVELSMMILVLPVRYPLLDAIMTPLTFL